MRTPTPTRTGFKLKSDLTDSLSSNRSFSTPKACNVESDDYLTPFPSQLSLKRKLGDDDENDIDHSPSGRDLYSFEKKIKRTKTSSSEPSTKAMKKMYTTAESINYQSPLAKKSRMSSDSSQKHTPKRSTPLKQVVSSCDRNTNVNSQSSDEDDSEIEYKQKRIRNSTSSDHSGLRSRKPRGISIAGTPNLPRICEIDENTDLVPSVPPTSAGRSPRIAMKRGTINAKSALGTPEFEKLKQQRIHQKEMKRLKEDTSEDSVSDISSSDESNLSNDEDCAELVDKGDTEHSYFNQLRDGKFMTSDNTLSAIAPLESTDILSILNKVPEKHPKNTKILLQQHRLQFHQWSFELSQGFNLIFYGFGSKIKIMEEYTEEYCLDASLITINGYHPSVTIRNILDPIIDHIIKPLRPVNQPLDQLKLIKDYFSKDKQDRKLYILIHNIDGENLRPEKTQKIISELASIPNIHLIATIDHINAALLWDYSKIDAFNWIWHDVTTYGSYTTEITFETSYLMHQSKNTTATLDLRGALYVLRSLPGNTKKIVKELAMWQLVAMKSMNMDHPIPKAGQRNEEKICGLTHRELFGRCAAKFITTNDILFRTQMVELTDHKIVISAPNGNKGDDLLFIPLDIASLEALIESSGH